MFIRKKFIINSIDHLNLFCHSFLIQLVLVMSGDFLILQHKVVEVCVRTFSLVLLLFSLDISGAFLIPYFVLYFLIGAPLYYMELALGQFTSRGPATGFVLARGWQGDTLFFFIIFCILMIDYVLGVGIAMIINSVLGTLYYNVIIAWALFYFVLSFRKRLLWADCGHWWNTERCFVPGSESDRFSENGTMWNCTAAQFANFSDYGCQQMNETGKVTASEEFY